MVSSLDPEWSLTIYNAASTPYTLTIMSIVAGIFVPVVLAYQAWTYWVFRHRIDGRDASWSTDTVTGCGASPGSSLRGRGRCTRPRPRRSRRRGRRRRDGRCRRGAQPRDRRGVPARRERARPRRRRSPWSRPSRCCARRLRLGAGGPGPAGLGRGPHAAVRDRAPPARPRPRPAAPSTASATGEIANTLSAASRRSTPTSRSTSRRRPRRARAGARPRRRRLRRTRCPALVLLLTFPLVPLFMWLIGGAAQEPARAPVGARSRACPRASSTRSQACRRCAPSVARRTRRDALERRGRAPPASDDGGAAPRLRVGARARGARDAGHRRRRGRGRIAPALRTGGLPSRHSSSSSSPRSSTGRCARSGPRSTPGWPAARRPIA